jgi:hypothetical protein
MPASSARSKRTTPPTMRKSAAIAFSSLSSAATSTVGIMKMPALPSAVPPSSARWCSQS